MSYVYIHLLKLSGIILMVSFIITRFETKCSSVCESVFMLSRGFPAVKTVLNNWEVCSISTPEHRIADEGTEG